MASPRRPRRKAGPSSSTSILIRLLVVLGLATLGVHGGREVFDSLCLEPTVDDVFSKPLWVSQKCDIDLKLQPRGSNNGLQGYKFRHLSSLHL